jgi:catechol 2,3-dioxygenase-like lactoylglutathione lyase family enzyme
MTCLGIQWVEIGVSDLARSREFYSELLQGRTDEVSFVEVDTGGIRQPVDNLRRGLGHIGWKVGDVDMHAERLRTAGVEFVLDPTDAPGGVRIAFFLDPDGTLLELIDRHLQYHTTFSPRLADAERLAAESRSRTAPPALDHVGATVADLDRSLAFYGKTLGYEAIGEIVTDNRECVLTMIGSGRVALELFTYATATTPNPASGDAQTLGMRAIGVVAAGGAPADPDGIPLRIASS